MGHGWYIVNEELEVTPLPPGMDFFAWRDHVPEGLWRVGHDALGDGLYRVSTVLLGLDHNFGDGPPVVFETMVFLGDSLSEIASDRYETWSDAETGHRAMVQRVLTGEFREEAAAWMREQADTIR